MTAVTSPNHTSLSGQISRMIQEQGIKHDPRSGLDYYSGYGTSLYDWELYFDAVLLAYYGLEQYAWNNVRILLSSQKDNGFIPRHYMATLTPRNPWSIFESEEHCKPFLCQVALILARLRGNVSWLSTDDFARLRRYLDHWLLAWDADGTGLSEWSSAPHSGCDTQFERMGYWRSRFCEGVDLNCYLYRECRAAEVLAQALGRPHDASYFAAEAGRKQERIQALLWDDRDGFYYDRDLRTGNHIRVKGGSGFMPLWAGIASPEQARRLVEEHLTHPDEFWTPYPIPGYARSEPRYSQSYQPQPGVDYLYALGPGHCTWNGGLWPHWDYLIPHGLQSYGYHEEAKYIAARFLAVIERDPAMHEWYNAETGDGMGATPFSAGATALGALLATELTLGLDPTRLAGVDDRLDISRLQQAVDIIPPAH